MVPTAPALHHTIAQVRAAVTQERRAHPGAPIVLVPTMGALHAGHLEHVVAARKRGGRVVVSIFVNPLQFGVVEDLDRYPRTLDTDVAALAAAGAHHVFAPSASEMYPHGAQRIRVDAVAEFDAYSRFEGALRPGHFAGVLTVVSKLFNIVQPDIATFGQKDAQQLALVSALVDELNLPIELIPIPIVREADGLALSSRNRYLQGAQRTAALAVPGALDAVVAAARNGREPVLQAGRATFESLASGSEARLEYLDLVDPGSFAPVAQDFSGSALAIIAAYIGSTRLIDNKTVELRA